MRASMPLPGKQPLPLELHRALPNSLVALGTDSLPEDCAVHREPDDVDFLALKTGKNVNSFGVEPAERWLPNPVCRLMFSTSGYGTSLFHALAP